MDKNFYRAFEDKFRGSRELILSRLAIYRPFIKVLRQYLEQAAALDLGCGRGEWLEFLGGEGIDALGVDIDESMLKACDERQLKTKCEEAVSYLAGLPDECLAVISAFHVVEHIPFDQLQVLIKEAFRVLRPGGLLIMETPNPENIQVGTHTFYIDPTHRRPIPPALLAFLPEYRGFATVKILRLQHSERLASSPSPSLFEVLEGVSADYAVIAQKAAAQAVMAAFDALFNADQGLTLHTLASRYDAEQDRRIKQTHSFVEQFAETASLAATHAHQALNEAKHAETLVQRAITAHGLIDKQLAQFETALQRHAEVEALTDARFEATLREHRAAEARTNARFDITLREHKIIAAAAEARINARLDTALQQHQLEKAAAEARIREMLNSNSWRITAPLRWLSEVLQEFKLALSHTGKAVVRHTLLKGMHFAFDRPNLRRLLAKLIRHVPRAHHRLNIFAIHYGLIPPAPVTGSNPEEPNPILTPDALRIYAKLKKSIAND
ncbi:class I SAM-dependent methyltransferase [Variovorax robiniae]|uniref:Class I SAM-dependent methyltransferase n=1 Tax=Variovorax robiniae TaxID=1836199 RepID=A0ABU8X6L7_9BURK